MAGRAIPYSFFRRLENPHSHQHSPTQPSSPQSLTHSRPPSSPSPPATLPTRDMPSLKQIDANRRNAQKSTGPRTPEGKAAVRLNALKHGIFAEDPTVTGEDSEAFEAIRNAFLARFQPAGIEAETLVYSLVRNAWLLDRLAATENQIW